MAFQYRNVKVGTSKYEYLIIQYANYRSPNWLIQKNILLYTNFVLNSSIQNYSFYHPITKIQVIMAMSSYLTRWLVKANIFFP